MEEVEEERGKNKKRRSLVGGVGKDQLLSFGKFAPGRTLSGFSLLLLLFAGWPTA